MSYYYSIIKFRSSIYYIIYLNKLWAPRCSIGRYKRYNHQMTKISITDRKIKQLELDLAKLNLQVVDKEQQLAEAKLELAAENIAKATSSHRRYSPKHTSPSTYFAKKSPPWSKKSPPHVSTTHTTFDHSVPAVSYTGLKDTYKNKLFVGDRVRLKKGSTGALKHLFCRGDIVKIVGTTSDNYLILDHSLYPIHSTTRLSKNIAKEFSKVASANLQVAH